MSEMETEEGPMDPTDPVEETPSARSTSADPTQAPIEVIDTPHHSSEPAPGDSEPGPDEGNRPGDPQDMEAESDGTDEKLPLGNEELEPWDREVTPEKVTPPSEAGKDTREGSEEVGPTVSAAERCVTPTDLLLIDSPSRPRPSPKRKQLSPPEGSKAATEWENTVKQHCGSTPERTPSSRLPGRMPYGLPPATKETASGVAESEGDGSMEPLQEEVPVDSPIMLQDENKPLGPLRGDEVTEFTPTALSGEDKPAGPLRNGPTGYDPIMEALDLFREDEPVRPLGEEGSGTIQERDEGVETSDQESVRPPSDPETFDQDV